MNMFFCNECKKNHFSEVDEKNCSICGTTMERKDIIDFAICQLKKEQEIRKENV